MIAPLPAKDGGTVEKKIIQLFIANLIRRAKKRVSRRKKTWSGFVLAEMIGRFRKTRFRRRKEVECLSERYRVVGLPIDSCSSLELFVLSIMQRDVYALCERSCYVCESSVGLSHHDGWTSWPHHLFAT